MDEIPLIGAHIPIKDGLGEVASVAHSIGATTMQIFTASQRQWHTKPIEDHIATAFIQGVEKNHLHMVLSHAAYLINIGSPKADVRSKSIDALRREIARCQQLHIPLVNVHPGSALEASREACLEAVVDGVLSLKDIFDNPFSVRLLFENSAGQGSCVGTTFEELSYLIERTKDVIPVGICLDTCHLFVAGYDIRSACALKKTVVLFDDIVGLQHLYAMHINDSEGDLGSRKDRHMPLGTGCIGEEAFISIMNEPSLQKIPKYLETPGGLEDWKKEIFWLKSQISDTMKPSV